jgi:predicted amidophosphoribosyltransferase
MQSKGPCARCLERQVVIHRQMAACEALGPMLTLKNGIQQGKREMILAAASLMAYQWLEQKMPLPDILIPLPVSFWQKQRQGFDSHLLLAQEIGKILSIPILNLLKMKTDWETFLAEGKFEERFYFKSPDSLCDRHLLLIHPLLEDTKFRKAAEALKAHFPGRIDALAFTDH